MALRGLEGLCSEAKYLGDVGFQKSSVFSGLEKILQALAGWGWGWGGQDIRRPEMLLVLKIMCGGVGQEEERP